MKSKTKRILTIVLCFALAFILGGEVFLSAFSIKAEAAVSTLINTTDPLDDLKGGMVNGVVFDTKTFNFDSRKETAFLTFLEYGYSFDGSKNEDFALYFYIYNPKGLDISVYKRHRISLRVGSNEAGSYDHYDCGVIEECEYDDYYGLFYKLRIILSPSDVELFFSKSADLNSSKRVYSVGEVELYLDDGTCVPIGVGDDYYFSGYMAGYGPNAEAGETLSCTVDDSLIISPDVRFAYYRPTGTQEGTKYVQDSLHSCYFAIEKEIVDEYGECVEMHAEFYNAVLKPGLITGNEAAYKALLSYVGKDIGDFDLNLPYAYVGGLNINGGNGYEAYIADISYNWNPKISVTDTLAIKNKIKALYLLFPTDFSEDSADTWVLAGQEIQERMLAISKTLTGDTKLYDNGYSSLLFESYDTEKREIRVTPDNLDTPIMSEVITQNWWQKILGTGTVHTEKFDGIKGIHKVTAADFSGDGKTDEEKAQALFVSKGDYLELKSYFEKHESTHYVYLFRYQVSDYTAYEATLYEARSLEDIDTNAYFFQMSCNLDFDVIDCTFEKNGVRTVIPVVMEPKDFIPDGTGPVYTESDRMDALEMLYKLLLLVVAVVVVATLASFCAPVMAVLKLCLSVASFLIRSIFKILTFPLRLLWRFLTKKRKP